MMTDKIQLNSVQQFAIISTVYMTNDMTQEITWYQITNNMMVTSTELGHWVSGYGVVYGTVATHA
jgi:hypothetical protein